MANSVEEDMLPLLAHSQVTETQWISCPLVNKNIWISHFISALLIPLNPAHWTLIESGIGKLANGTKWCILVTHLLCMLHFTAALLSVKTLNYQHPKTLPLKGKIPNPPPSLNNYPNNHIVFYWRPPDKPLIWCEMWIPAHLRLNEGWIICHLIWGKQLLVILKQAAQR